ncbi:MAG: 4-hydroxy-tetrahydrodipicolinate synthase [Methermicoccaceae archaeon]
MFEGASVALITPFTKEDRVDVEGFKRNITHVIEGGVSSILPCGTTGESATLSFEEHMEVIRVAVEHSTVPVIAGTGSNNTKEAVELTKFAADVGADAALVITPYYNKPNPRGIIKHYEAIMDACDIPIVLYNIKSRTGLNIPPDLMAELASYSAVIGVKEASGDLGQISRIVEMTRDEDFFVISGDDAMTLPVMALGGIGVISVVANIAPSMVAALTDSMLKGEYDRARKLHYELSPLVRAMFLETNPVPVKKACELMGLASGHLRLPMAELGEENVATLRVQLEAVGLL